jgi:glycosyltransferase involved in cell wall biosynthesis
MLTNRYGNHSGPDLSLVMPCYNEEAVVERTIARLLAAFGKAGYELELVAVDNGSWDGTTGILQGLAKQNPAVVYHRVEKNEGYGNGVTAGFPLCAAPWVGLIPADGQVDPEDVVRVYEAAVAANQWVVAKVRRLFRMERGEPGGGARRGRSVLMTASRMAQAAEGHPFAGGVQ